MKKKLCAIYTVFSFCIMKLFLYITVVYIIIGSSLLHVHKRSEFCRKKSELYNLVFFTLSNLCDCGSSSSPSDIISFNSDYKKAIFNLQKSLSQMVEL